MEGITLYRFIDEEIAETWMSYDLFGLMHQLGVTPEIDALEAEAISANVQVRKSLVVSCTMCRRGFLIDIFG